MIVSKKHTGTANASQTDKRYGACGIFFVRACLLAALSGPSFTVAAADETVVLQLKWRHQFQFAGYYAAQAKGYYAEEGLDVRIEPAQPNASSIKEVADGRAQFGVSDSAIMLARMEGMPLVACAAIFQHAPTIILSRRDRNIRTPADLAGKTIMMSDTQGAAQVHMMLRREGINPGTLKIVPHTWRLSDLIEGRVDAVSAYLSVEPPQLRALGVEASYLKAIDYGVDFYGDTLFTSETQVQKYPERTEAFVRASLRGWSYALNNPGEIADLILTLPGVSERGVTREQLLAEAAAMKPLILSDVVEIGHMNLGRWQHIARSFAELQIAPREVSLEGFLLDTHPHSHTSLTRPLVRIALAASVIAALILLWNLQIRRRVHRRTRELAAEVAHRTRIENDLRTSEARFRMMFTDAATGIAVITPDGRYLQTNPSYCATSGYTETELAGLSLHDLLPPEDRATFQRLSRGLLEGPEDHFVVEIRCIKKSGVIVWKRASVSLVRTADGQPNNLIVVAEDITARREAEHELARVNRAQRMLGACNEALIRAESETELLHDICNVAVEIGGYRMAWAGFALQDEARTIQPVTHAGAEDGYLSKISLSWDDTTPGGKGPAGSTIRDGRTTLLADIETAHSFSFAREPAREHGYRGVICLPLAGELRTHGLLALYSGEVLTIGADEIKLLEQLATDLAFGLNILRIRAERQKTQEALITVARAVSASVGVEFFHQLTHSMVTALGADIGVIGTLDPDNPTQCHTLCVVAGGKRLDNFTYSLIGAPCEDIAPNQPCIVARDVRKLYPSSQLMADLRVEAYVGHPLVTSEGRLLGIIAVLYHQPLERTDFIASSLQILASRAASELDRRHVDTRLREQAALLDKAQDAIIVRDLDHHITYWNKSAERLYGWTAAEVVNRSAAELLYKDSASFHEAMRQVLADGEWVGELSQINKQGADLMIEGRWTLVRDESGTPRSVLAINTDITAKKNLEHQFLRAQRMESIGTLAGGIAHDLNNVLAPVIMASDLIKLQETDTHKLALLNTISTSARRGADMVGQVLSFARGMDGRRIEVQARHLLHDIEKITHDTFPKNIVIDTRINGDLWTLTGDPTQLHQVLLNLCVNARDAMPAGGQLTLSAENLLLNEHDAALNIEAKAGPHVVIDVEDTGTGIPRSIIEKIFDPFFTTKAVGKGTGLGLSTTLAIVKSHGGFIRVFSEVNRGTRFRIHLPACCGEASLPVPGAVPDLPRGRDETILVIDDEPSIREVTRQILEAFGYRVLDACDGAQGLAVYAEHHAEIAAVIIDMMMPVMEGTVAVPLFLKINPDVRIIAASGITANGHGAKTAGVKHFLPKPYPTELLLKTLRQMIDAPQA